MGRYDFLTRLYNEKEKPEKSENLNQGKIINPYAPKKANITITVDLAGGPVNMSTDVSLPYNVLIGVLLGTAVRVSEEWARADSLIIKPNEKGGNNDGEKKGSDNRGNDGP